MNATVLMPIRAPNLHSKNPRTSLTFVRRPRNLKLVFEAEKPETGFLFITQYNPTFNRGIMDTQPQMKSVGVFTNPHYFENVPLIAQANRRAVGQTQTHRLYYRV